VGGHIDLLILLERLTLDLGISHFVTNLYIVRMRILLSIYSECLRINMQIIGTLVIFLLRLCLPLRHTISPKYFILYTKRL
jgi:hypothetical protein